jgi:adenosylmethionine-8-amino-7-oxononanoate aminotransferase
VLAPSRIVERVARSGGFTHGHTYFTNPLSCAVARAVLDEVVRQDLPARAARMGSYLISRLEELATRSPIVGHVRGKGLLCAIEIVADKATKRSLPTAFNAPSRLSQIGFSHGIALYNRRANQGAYGDFQMIAPPLIVTASEIDEMVTALERSLLDLQAQIEAEGLARF